MKTISSQSMMRLGPDDARVRSRRRTRFVQSGAGFHEFGDTTEKRGQRDAVASYILSTHENNRGLRLMSLPGESWAVERQINFNRSACCFVACERDEQTFLRAGRWMPSRSGESPSLTSHRFKDLGSVSLLATFKATLLNCDASRYLAHRISKQELANHDAVIFSRYLRSRMSAFWLDSFSPLGCTSTIQMVRGMARRSDRRGSVFAIAFTIGRDERQIANAINACPGEDALEKRAAFLELLIQHSGRRVVVEKLYRHHSWNKDGSLHIGTIMGKVLPLKDRAAQDNAEED